MDITADHLLVADPAVTRAPLNGAAAGANGGASSAQASSAQASSAQASSVLANMTLDGMAQARILRRGADTGRLTHIHRVPARRGRQADWPGWLPAELREALAGIGAGAAVDPPGPGRAAGPRRAAT